MYFKLDVQMFQWLFISILFMLLDMGSKYWIKVHYYLYEKLYLFPGINFFYVKNFGLAFGLCSSFSIYWYYFLIWIIFIIIMVFVIFLYKSIGFSKYINIAYTMLIGGSLGNLFDRIVYGAVIDFIDIHIGNWHWPVFNIADIEIFVGMMILFIKFYCYHHD